MEQELVEQMVKDLLGEVRNLRIENTLLLEKLKKVESVVKNEKSVKEKLKRKSSGVSLKKVLLMPIQTTITDSKRKHVDDKRTNEGISNYSYEEVEVLEEEIEEESLVLSEVCRIKEILANPDGSTSLVYESLRTLELMQLSIEILKATEVDKWGKIANSVINSPDDVSPFDTDSINGLLFPPLDRDTFLPIQTIPKDMLVFDGMDNNEYSLQQLKLEVAKRRLQEGYQQAEDAKKKRTVLMIDLKDLPKQKSNLRRR
eukprot:Gb_25307 [translate_table: standard]